MKSLTILSAFVACTMSVAFLASFNMNVQNRNALSNAPRVSVCFDAHGRVTSGEDWKECKMMRAL